MKVENDIYYTVITVCKPLILLETVLIEIRYCNEERFTLVHDTIGHDIYIIISKCCKKS